MSNTAQRLALLRHIVKNIDFKKVENGPIEVTFCDAFVKSKFGPSGAIGIRKEAGEALLDLATDFFGQRQFQQSVTFEELYNELTDIFIFKFFEKRNTEQQENDLKFVGSELDNWLESNVGTEEFYIPCSLSPWPAAEFSIGPVKFTHVQIFAMQERQATGVMFDLTYGKMLEAMTQAQGYWIATVAIEDCTQKRAEEIANITIDIALAGLQLIVPFGESAGISRLSGRARPNSLHVISRRDGKIGISSTNQAPGRSMGEGMLVHYLQKGQVLAGAIGSRVKSFAKGEGNFPILEQAWADAAYWFHEAVLEPLDTIAVTKFETAIEVLLRSESTSGSKTRVLKAIEVFFGLKRDDVINPHSQLTVEKFAEELVRDRSRILHGTWSTLNHSLHDSRSSLSDLVGNLLAWYALKLEGYVKTPNSNDDVESFLDWVASTRSTEVTSAAST